MNITDVTIYHVIGMIFFIVFVYTGAEMIYKNSKKDKQFKNQ